MSSINGCAFCRANRKPWTTHTVEVCAELAKCVCGYCKETGHTTKRCPKIALKKQRQEEYEKKQEEKKQREEQTFPTLIQPISKPKAAPTTCWSSIVVKSLTEEEKELMEQQHREKKQKKMEEAEKKAKAHYEERKRIRKENAIKAEQYYVRKMRGEYGIDECGIGQPGDFWYFFVEGRKDDSNMAKVLRENIDNQRRFQDYLCEKYFVNWLSRTEYSDDDCPILDRWRWEEEKMQYEMERIEEERVSAYLKAEDELQTAMKEKLEKGEITQAEYNEWKWEKEIEDDYAFQAEGDTHWRCYEQNEREYAAWKQRSAERKEKYGSN